MATYQNEAPPQLRYLGTRFTPVSLADTVSLLASRQPDAAFALVVTPNAQHVVYAAKGDARFQAPIEQAWLAPADSRVVARLARLLRGIKLPLCHGSDLTLRLFGRTIQASDRIAIIGGDRELAGRLRTRYGLTALAQHIPPMDFIRDPAAVAAAIDFAENAAARFLFIACGAPQSEQLGLMIQQRGIASGIGICVGASLMFISGQAKRAPRFLRAMGLESVYRLAQEPRRLGRRFVTGQLPVVGLAIRDAMRGGGRKRKQGSLLF